MAEFADEKKIQDVMLDFGELGKWSRETLQEHILGLPMGRVVGGSPYNTALEKLYRDKLCEYDKEIFQLSNWRVGIRTVLRDISWRLAKRDQLFEDRDKLCKDFQKYFDLFPERQKHMTNKL